MTISLQNRPHLTIVVALACEAKPIVDYLRLRKRRDTIFSHYVDRNDVGNEIVTNLVVSGIGSLNMAAAVAWVGAQLPVRNSAWLNVGIAGHQRLDVGSCLRVVACQDLVTEGRFYPPLVSKWDGENAKLISCNTPTDNYPSNMAVDMEASAFFATTSKFSSLEYAQSIKVVSDNPEFPAERLNANLISDLIQPHVERILKFANSLVSVVPQVVEPLRLPNSVLALHYTKSQEMQLKELCRKLQSIGFDDDRLAVEIASFTSIKEILTNLEFLQLNTSPELREE